MATEQPRLTVTLTPTALRHLTEIWDYNARAYGMAHAESYIEFLNAEVERLATRHHEGKSTANPLYRHVAIKRSRRGHGHVAVYSVTEETVEALAFYHTAQDWQGKIERGEI